MEELGETDNSVSLNHIVSYFPNKFCDNITIISYGFKESEPNDAAIQVSPSIVSVQTQSNPILHSFGKICCT